MHPVGAELFHTDRQQEGRWTDGWMDGQTDGRTDRRMDGQT